ncbi:MAG: DNA polymerase III subunit delta [Anaerovoracaceae bacterium]|jgi:DNA polymerase-3 subunit delta
MAQRKTDMNVHAFKRIDEELKGDGLRSPLFFYGKERYLIDWAIDAIVKKYVNPLVRDMDFNKNEASQISFAQIRNQCETLPIMSDKRVVLVEGFSPFKGERLDSFPDGDVERLSEYFLELPDTCILIFTGFGTDKRLKLYKSLEKCGGSYDFQKLDEKTLGAWIMKKLKAADKYTEPSVISQIQAITGYHDKDSDYTLYNLENDLCKAIAHSEGQRLTVEDILETVTGNLLVDVFALLDSMSSGHKDEALGMLHNLRVMGHKEYQILGLICSQLEIMLSVKEMKREGKSFREMQEILGVHEYRIKKGMEFASKYELHHLQRVLIKAYEIDKNGKAGILDWWLGFELLIGEM